MLLDTPTIREAIRLHQKFYDEEHYNRVADQLIEEMAEVAQALLKRRRGVFPHSNNQLFDELADMQLCIEFLTRAEQMKPEYFKNRIDELAFSLIADLESKGVNA